jgi:16S rRNA (guanine527-N7)-methyltransferase
MSVSRETVAETVARFPVLDPEATTDQIKALLDALAAEPDPPTTVRDPQEALDIHVADSLSALELAPVRTAARVADIGAGAGFPGLVLAAALSALSVDLIESTRRKCEVIDRLASAAGLDTHARAIPTRAEEWAAADGHEAYDVVTARALAPLPVLCEYAAPLLRLGGALVAWKGVRNADEEAAGERAAAQVGLGAPEIIATTPYPGSQNRHLHVYSKVSETPAKYPRRVGLANRKPIA